MSSSAPVFSGILIRELGQNVQGTLADPPAEHQEPKSQGIESALVRAVVLNYRQAELTLKCVSSLLEQSYKPLQVVVVDNSELMSESESLSQRLPASVLFLQNTRNLGYAAGNNVGLKPLVGLSNPEYSLVVNNDVCFLHKDTILNLVYALGTNRDAAAVSPMIALTGTAASNTAVQVRRCPTYAAMLIAYSCWLKRLPMLSRVWKVHTYQDLMPFQNGRLHRCDSINGACFLIRQSFLGTIGYLDEGTFLYAEELILALQIREKGKTCLLHSGESVQHLQGATTGQSYKRVEFSMFRHEIRSELYLCRKYLRCARWQCGTILIVRLIDFLFRKAQMHLLRPARPFAPVQNA